MNVLLKETYLAQWNLLYQLFISHHFFPFSWGQKVVGRVAKQVIDIGRISRSSKLKKNKREKENTCSCKPVSVMPFTVPYLERERYIHNLLVPGEMLKYILGPG